jgi:hypothetical protein
MGIFDVVEIVSKISEMKTLISEVSDKELKLKLNENLQWLTENLFKTETIL